MKILDVKIDNLTRQEAQERLADFLKDGRQHLITTPNPEFILAAQKDEGFKDILNRADLALPDGFGLILISRLIGARPKEQICGSDFIFDICALAEKMNQRVFLLGAGEGVAVKAAVELSKKYPRLKIAGAEEGIQISNFPGLASTRPRAGQFPISNCAENQELIKRINLAQPNIIFVAFGQVKQEKWLAENLPRLPSVKIAMGVGGVFDFLAGVVPRAPRCLRRAGLEWLWRLILQPRRWRRILRAVIKFPILAIYDKIK